MRGVGSSGAPRTGSGRGHLNPAFCNGVDRRRAPLRQCVECRCSLITSTCIESTCSGREGQRSRGFTSPAALQPGKAASAQRGGEIPEPQQRDRGGLHERRDVDTEDLTRPIVPSPTHALALLEQRDGVAYPTRRRRSQRAKREEAPRRRFGPPMRVIGPWPTEGVHEWIVGVVPLERHGVIEGTLASGPGPESPRYERGDATSDRSHPHLHGTIRTLVRAEPVLCRTIPIGKRYECGRFRFRRRPWNGTESAVSVAG